MFSHRLSYSPFPIAVALAPSYLEGSCRSSGLELRCLSGSSAKDDVDRTMAAAQRSWWAACRWCSRCRASCCWSLRWWTAPSLGMVLALLGIAGEVLPGAHGPRVLRHGRMSVYRLQCEEALQKLCCYDVAHSE
jgi:hypothetical protein